jgi:PIN domain nuclease of toxin-antitoxin system
MKAKALSDDEIKMKGIEVLNKSLGHSAALRFLSLLHKEPTDYVKISKRIYKNQTIDDIFHRAKRKGA